MAELDRLIPRIKTIITKYGKSVTRYAKVTKDYDPTTGTTTVSGLSENPCKITPPEPWTKDPLPGVAVLMGDMSCYTDTVSGEPSIGDTLAASDWTKDWTIVGVGRIYTGDLVGLYVLQLRL